jgi:D-alanyl-D-alanine carboxypeptidase
MKLFNKKSKYSYENQYYKGQGKLRKDRVLIVSVVGILFIMSILIMFNITRIRFLWKGYSLNEISVISTLNDDQEALILSQDKIDNILDWMELSEDVSLYYNYQRYLEMFPEKEKEEVVEYMNLVFTTHVPKLKSLGYSDNIIWELLEVAISEDFQYLIDNNLTAQDIDGFRKVEGYIIQNTLSYMEVYKENNNYNYCVNIVNYPFIISGNEINIIIKTLAIQRFFNILTPFHSQY